MLRRGASFMAARQTFLDGDGFFLHITFVRIFQTSAWNSLGYGTGKRERRPIYARGQMRDAYDQDMSHSVSRKLRLNLPSRSRKRSNLNLFLVVVTTADRMNYRYRFEFPAPQSVATSEYMIYTCIDIYFIFFTGDDAWFSLFGAGLMGGCTAARSRWRGTRDMQILFWLLTRFEWFQVPATSATLKRIAPGEAHRTPISLTVQWPWSTLRPKTALSWIALCPRLLTIRMQPWVQWDHEAKILLHAFTIFTRNDYICVLLFVGTRWNVLTFYGKGWRESPIASAGWSSWTNFEMKDWAIPEWRARKSPSAAQRYPFDAASSCWEYSVSTAGYDFMLRGVKWGVSHLIGSVQDCSSSDVQFQIRHVLAFDLKKKKKRCSKPANALIVILSFQEPQTILCDCLSSNGNMCKMLKKKKRQAIWNLY